MKKLLYLYITPFFPSPNSWQGGFCLDAVKALQADGRYEIVVMTANDYGGDYEINGIKVYQFSRLRFGASEYFESIFIKYNNKKFLNKLNTIGIKVENIAVCHVHDYVHYVQYAIVIKKRNPKCLTLVHHHYAGFYDISIGKLGVVPLWSELLYIKMRREFETVDAHIFISYHSKKYFSKRIDFDTGEDKGLLRNQLIYGRFFRDIRLLDSYVWYNGIDKDVFKKVEFGPTQKNFKIGCVGNYNPCKSQIDLIKAFEIVIKIIPHAKLTLVGDGQTLSECKEYVENKELSQTVEFLPPMRHDNLNEFYRSLDLFVMPSVNEGFCCVNVESHACGTPFIAIKGLPMEEILDEDEREKWLVPPHDIKALAEKIIDFFNHPILQHLSVDLDINVLSKKFVDWTFEKRLKMLN